MYSSWNNPYEPRSSNVDRQAAISSLWHKRIRTGASVCAICNVCGGSSSGTCRCARRRWEEHVLTEQEIQEEIQEAKSKREINRKVAEYRKQLEQEHINNKLNK